MFFILITAYFLGMAATIPMGPVGSLLLRVPSKKWFRALLALWLIDVVISFFALLSTDPFLKISSSPHAKLVSSLFLLGFALQGFIKQKPPVTNSNHRTTSVRKVVTVALANPGTYLMVGSAFIFLDLSSLRSLPEKWLTLAFLSFGAVSWYHFVRFVFRKKNAMFQYRFERLIYVVIGAIGGFSLVAIVVEHFLKN